MTRTLQEQSSLTTGYVSNATEQPASALLGIKIVIGPIPAVLLFSGIIFAIFYPLSREKYTHIVTELTRRKEARRLEREKKSGFKRRNKPNKTQNY